MDMTIVSVKLMSTNLKWERRHRVREVNNYMRTHSFCTIWDIYLHVIENCLSPLSLRLFDQKRERHGPCYPLRLQGQCQEIFDTRVI